MRTRASWWAAAGAILVMGLAGCRSGQQKDGATLPEPDWGTGPRRGSDESLRRGAVGRVTRVEIRRDRARIAGVDKSYSAARYFYNDDLTGRPRELRIVVGDLGDGGVKAPDCDENLQLAHSCDLSDLKPDKVLPILHDGFAYAKVLGGTTTNQMCKIVSTGGAWAGPWALLYGRSIGTGAYGTEYCLLSATDRRKYAATDDRRQRCYAKVGSPRALGKHDHRIWTFSGTTAVQVTADAQGKWVINGCESQTTDDQRFVNDAKAFYEAIEESIWTGPSAAGR